MNQIRKNYKIGGSVGKTKFEMGEFFRKARKTRGIAQTTLAKKLGYSRGQFVSNWERGLCQVPTNKLARVIKELDLNSEMVATAMVSNYRAEIRKAIFR